MSGNQSPRAGRARLSFEQLESRLVMAGVVINEFVADNADGLTDQDGDNSDWIELKNTDAAPVDITGWYLTDSATNLTKWQLPTTVLGAGQSIVIFASSKNRAVAGQELHTNFALSAGGEYLGLVMANGTTVASDFGAAFPEQHEDVSYGAAATTSSTSNLTLVGASSALSVISPTAEDTIGPATLDDDWRKINFDDSGWLTGTRSVGFDRDGDGTNFTPFIGRVLSAAEMPSTAPNTRTTAYVRYEFNVTDVAQLTSLQLDVRFDDGMMVFINDHAVESVNFGEFWQKPQPQWNSSAGYMLREGSSLIITNRGAEALTPVTFDLTPYLSDLVNGQNVLAFHMVNSASTTAGQGKDDLLLEPILTAVRATGAGTGLYMLDPTPGANNGVGTQGLVADTQFSVDRGFFDAPFQVAITTATAGAEIRYTTDGSAPTLSSSLYSAPLNINTTTILRAAAFKSGWTSSNVDTQTYIFLEDVIGQNAADAAAFGSSATWGRDKDGDTLTGYDLDNEADWEMDPDIVNDPRWSSTIIDDLKAIPSMSVVMDWDDLFSGTPQPGTPTTPGAVAPSPQGMYIHGRGDERPMSLEYFNPNNPADRFQIDGSIETQGHTSQQRWKSDKLSFEVKFKSPYGPADLDYPLFADALYGENAATEFDSLILDATHNYGWTHANHQQFAVARFVTDQVMADLQLLAGGQAAHGKYVHLYLNGLYWGLYNVHERPTESFAAEYYGGDKDDYDVIKHASDDPSRKFSYVEGGVTAENTFQAMIDATQAVQNAPTNAALYEAVQNVLDVDDFIDYMIVHYYGGNVQDWSNNNWYASRNRVAPGAKWHFHAWDQEHAFPTDDNQPLGQNTGEDADSTGFDQTQTPTAIHKNLIANEEYRLKFSDHVQKLMFNGGILTPSVAADIYDARAAEIDRAIVGESARWGDNRLPFTNGSYTRTAPYNRDDFITIKNDILDDFFPVRTGIVLDQFTPGGLFTTNDWLTTLAAPNFSQYGGEVTSGYMLTLTNPNAGGTIYYTTDGSDPRNVGGTIHGTAYSGPIEITASTQVKARVLDASLTGSKNDWSALIDASFTLPEPFPVRITEIHYNPAGHPGVVAENMEFIEFTNTGASAVDLTGMQITGFDATPYTFGSIMLAAGDRIIVARDIATFQQVYGTGINVAPTGFAPRNLSNGGETITFADQSFAYDDVAGWAPEPDGGGPSLEIIDPLGNQASPANWRASGAAGGSPGLAEVIQGDYDYSGDVETGDQSRWTVRFGDSVTPTLGADGNGDGVVDAADYVMWVKLYGAAGGGGGGFAALPQGDGGGEGATNDAPATSASPLVEPTFTAAPPNESIATVVVATSDTVAAPLEAKNRTDSIAFGIANSPSVASRGRSENTFASAQLSSNSADVAILVDAVMDAASNVGADKLSPDDAPDLLTDAATDSIEEFDAELWSEDEWDLIAI